MASLRAFAAVTEGIVAILSESRASLRVTNPSSVAVEVMRVADLSQDPEGGEGRVTVHLYRVAVNTTRRVQAGRLGPDGRRTRPPLSLDLHFMIAAWARDPLLQMTLLAWAMRTLEDHPHLDGTWLNRQAAGDERIFAVDETIDLVASALPQTELVAVWEFNKSLMRPCMTYTARMVLLDSELPLPDHEPVRVRELNAGGAG